MDARSVGGIGFDEDAIDWQSARERSAFMGGQGQSAAQREEKVAFEEGARLFEAAAEGVEKAPDVGGGGDQVEEGVVGAHAVQDDGQTVTRGDSELRGEHVALASERNAILEPRVEAAFTEGVELRAVAGDELFEAVEAGHVVAFIQVGKRDRMEADADEHIWAFSQIERALPVVRSHGAGTAGVDPRATRSRKDGVAISVERGQLQVAVGVEHGVVPPKIAGALFRNAPMPQDALQPPPFTKARKPVVMAGR